MPVKTKNEQPLMDFLLEILSCIKFIYLLYLFCNRLGKFCNQSKKHYKASVSINFKMFSSSFDLYLKDKKSANATMACPRRRRANSDSELTFFDSFDRHKSWPDLPSPPFLMTSSLHDDVDIDIMGTDSNGKNLLILLINS